MPVSKPGFFGVGNMSLLHTTALVSHFLIFFLVSLPIPTSEQNNNGQPRLSIIILGFRVRGLDRGEGIWRLATYLDYFFIDSFIMKHLTRYLLITLPKIYEIFKIQI